MMATLLVIKYGESRDSPMNMIQMEVYSWEIATK